jgi:glycosyltransferase involved in cell wall biosynthesis
MSMRRPGAICRDSRGRRSTYLDRRSDHQVAVRRTGPASVDSDAVRVLLWHGWLLEGSGSNVVTARVTEELRTEGHDVLLLCQDPRAAGASFVDATGVVDASGVSALSPTGARPGPGRAVVLKPDIGPLLPVFVVDEYEGFQVKRFVDLTEPELSRYLERNISALRAAAAWFQPQAVIAGHAIPGAPVARRALGHDIYVAKIHGSDLEYAVRLQDRYRDLAREGLAGARAIVGPTRDALRRVAEVVPSIDRPTHVVPPGVDTSLFHPRARREALLDAADRLDADPDTERGRPDAFDAEVSVATAAGDTASLDELALRYDQDAPDPGASSRLRALAEWDGPLVGSFGKLIPQKGVELLVDAIGRLPGSFRCVIVGFGLYRERLAALVSSRGLSDRVIFTGRLDHRYAPEVLAALDVLVVPSVLEEAFGMVAAEGAAAGALPLVAGHSGLAEVAGALEGAVGRPGLFSFEPGPDAGARIAHGVRALLAIPTGDRARLRRRVAAFVRSEWTWRRTAERLLEAAT